MVKAQLIERIWKIVADVRKRKVNFGILNFFDSGTPTFEIPIPES